MPESPSTPFKQATPHNETPNPNRQSPSSTALHAFRMSSGIGAAAHLEEDKDSWVGGAASNHGGHLSALGEMRRGGLNEDEEYEGSESDR